VHVGNPCPRAASVAPTRGRRKWPWPTRRRSSPRRLPPARRACAFNLEQSSADRTARKSDGTQGWAARPKGGSNRPGLAGLLSTGIGHVASTITAVIGLLYFFLVSGDTFLRKLVLVTPALKDKKRAVEIVRNIETDISFYLVMVTAINIAIGLIVMATTGVLGIPDPILWGTLAAVLSFAPYVGEFAIVVLLSLAGILTFDSLVHALVAPAIYFVLMTVCWQGVVPFVVGRRMTLSPVAVFIMIIVLGWMWGVIGALVAVPVLASLKIICDRIRALHPIAEFLSP
jgi:predicted PurR-regulated permease PerM